jgi:hypothetical protein
MMNDELKAARLLTFIIHHSYFIIKTKTPPDTSVSAAACVGENFVRSVS